MFQCYILYSFDAYSSVVFRFAKLRIYFDIDIKISQRSKYFFPHEENLSTSSMEFELHREENLSTSRCNFGGIYRPEIDGIPLFQLHPTVKRLMIGYKIKRTVGRNIHVTATGKTKGCFPLSIINRKGVSLQNKNI